MGQGAGSLPIAPRLGLARLSSVEPDRRASARQNAARWKIIPAILAAAWRVVPMPATREVPPSGMVEMWSRSYGVLPLSGCRFGRTSRFMCRAYGSTETESLSLGIFEVIDTRDIMLGP